MRRKKIGIITGASSGLGRRFAIEIARKIELDEIWLVARREDRLDKVGDFITQTFGVPTLSLPLDLKKKKSIEKIEQKMAKENPLVKILVNASGFGFVGESQDIPRQDQEDMIKVNCLALFSLTHLISRYMQQGSGFIQVASAAAFCPQPYFSVYAASKSFVYSYAMAVSYELNRRKINTTILCPGPVATEFFTQVDKFHTGKIAYKNVFMKTTKEIVNAGMKGYFKGKRVVVPGISMKALYHLTGMSVQKIFARICAKMY